MSTPTDIPHLLAQCPLRSSQDIVLGALLDWAMLTIDPSGETVPTYVARRCAHLKPHNPHQQQQWHGYLARFYDCLVELMRLPEVTLAARNISRIQADLIGFNAVNLASAQQHYPSATTIHLQRRDCAAETAISHMFTAMMLCLAPGEALGLFEGVVVEWLRQLPRDQVDALQTSLYQRDAREQWSDAEIRCFALEYIAIMIQDAPL